MGQGASIEDEIRREGYGGTRSKGSRTADMTQNTLCYILKIIIQLDIAKNYIFAMFYVFSFFFGF
jgi:hypothetical protein